MKSTRCSIDNPEFDKYSYPLRRTESRPPDFEGSQCNQPKNLYARRVRPGALSLSHLHILKRPWEHGDKCKAAFWQFTAMTGRENRQRAPVINTSDQLGQLAYSYCVNKYLYHQTSQLPVYEIPTVRIARRRSSRLSHALDVTLVRECRQPAVLVRFLEWCPLP